MTKFLTKSQKLMRTITMFAYLTGLPYFWLHELKWPKCIFNLYEILCNILTVLIYIMVFMEILAVFTQKHLSEQQRSEAIKYAISQPILSMNFLSLTYYKEDIRKLIKQLMTDLPDYYKDEEVEKQFIKKTKLYVIACLFFMALTLSSVGFEGLWRVMFKDDVFTTVITAWPNVEDRSMIAGIARVMGFVIWWVYTVRLGAAITMVITLTICTSHQYKYLQSYFCSLQTIFEKSCSQSEKEAEYEKALIIGVKFHKNILSYTEDLGRICKLAYGGNIVVNVTVLAILLLQMMNGDRSFLFLLSCIITAIAVLVSNGFYMWTLGDITIEASHICTSMYMSGWENCSRRSSVAIRKLVTTAMIRAQKKVVIQTLMILKVSYGSFLSIVKFSYSVFSVFY